jgi:pSer/pThr/pTyr-binding forkhead associated (FHA) protein
MPLLLSGAERCTLRPGTTYTLGGRTPSSLPLSSLELSPEVATIVVPDSGPPTIQRLTASIVVRLDQVAIGIAPRPLPDGVEIEFNGARLTFTAGDIVDANEPVSEHTEEYRVEPATAPRIVHARTGNTIDLNGARVVIGRDDTCDVIVSGMDVSRRHCSIMPVQGGYLLRDESANGTSVNGSRISGTYLLGHGDVIRIGEEELRFEVEGGAAPASTVAAPPTAILDVSRIRSDYAAHTSTAATLEIVRGPYSGASFSIDRPVCSIGRAEESDVRIRDESVSSTHATLLRKGTQWFVVDLRSANGTFVDGMRIAGEREITSGARLTLGRVELEFRAIDANGAPIDPPKRKRWKLLDLLPF